MRQNLVTHCKLVICYNIAQAVKGKREKRRPKSNW